MVDYVDETTRCAKFGGDRFMGLLGDMRFLNYHSFYTLFSSLSLHICTKTQSNQNLNKNLR